MSNRSDGAETSNVETDGTLGEGISDQDMDDGIAMAIFDALDEDSSGTIDLDELRGGMSDSGMTDRDIEELMLKLDEDKNGSVDREEWMRGYSCFVDEVHGYTKAKFYDLRGPTGGFKIADTALRAIELEQLEKIYNHVKRRLKTISWKVGRPSKDPTKFTDVNLKDPKKINLYDLTSKCLLSNSRRLSHNVYICSTCN